jgi:hypothetical protein
MQRGLQESCSARRQWYVFVGERRLTWEAVVLLPGYGMVELAQALKHDVLVPQTVYHSMMLTSFPRLTSALLDDYQNASS